MQEKLSSKTLLDPRENLGKDSEQIPIEILRKAIKLTEYFYNDNSKEVTDYLLKEIRLIESILSKTPGFNGLFGLGYPYYALRKDGKPITIKSIQRFINIIKDKVDTHSFKKENSNFWTCGNCQSINNLPDLHSICSNCSFTNLKPKDIFTTLPDIDVIMVVDSINENIENNISKNLLHYGYKNYDDGDISGSIHSTMEVIDSIKKHSKSEKKLPVDVHLIDKKYFLDSLKKLQEGDFNDIEVRSMHRKWENYNLPFWFDFIFSMNEVTPFSGLDQDLRTEIVKTRNILKNNFGADKLIEYIREHKKRASSILYTNQALNILRARIDSW